MGRDPVAPILRDSSTEHNNDDMFNLPRVNNNTETPPSSPESSLEGSPTDGHKRSYSYDSKEPQKKRRRRTAAEIERPFMCEVCQKAYGSIGALNMHFKLKHKQSDKPRPSSRTRSIMNTEIVKKLENFDGIQQCIPYRIPSIDPSYFSAFDSFRSSPSPYPTTQASTVGQKPALETKPNDVPILSVPMLHLKICNWMKVSSFSGDLVAKFSFEERKFIWEIFSLDHSYQKVEISFDDVIRLEYSTLPDGTSALSLETCKAPQFYEGRILAHRQTTWQPSEALAKAHGLGAMQHLLHFLEDSLIVPFQNLLRLEPRFQFILATHHKRSLPSSSVVTPSLPTSSTRTTLPVASSSVNDNISSPGSYQATYFSQPPSEVEQLFYDVLQGRSSSLDTPITPFSISRNFSTNQKTCATESNDAITPYACINAVDFASLSRDPWSELNLLPALPAEH